eukprot:TRINITY_DN4822_c1_g2_i14.p2 TRINITY_DN4822_c1_g2~~TRINITY_DN4822_c1_g2_i14.p2  ORF type:complete len:269 (-),score=-7.86 TRINITY_DN4822_c1_g2_i14:1722-2528(-)
MDYQLFVQQILKQLTNFLPLIFMPTIKQTKKVECQVEYMKNQPHLCQNRTHVKYKIDMYIIINIFFQDKIKLNKLNATSIYFSISKLQTFNVSIESQIQKSAICVKVYTLSYMQLFFTKKEMLGQLFSMFQAKQNQYGNMKKNFRNQTFLLKRKNNGHQTKPKTASSKSKQNIIQQFNIGNHKIKKNQYIFIYIIVQVAHNVQKRAEKKKQKTKTVKITVTTQKTKKNKYVFTCLYFFTLIIQKRRIIFSTTKIDKKNQQTKFGKANN